MNWLYNENTIEDISQFPENTYGFVYKVTHTPTGKSYIGKKVLYFNKKTKLGKKEIATQTGPGRKPTTKIVRKLVSTKDLHTIKNKVMIRVP